MNRSIYFEYIAQKIETLSQAITSAGKLNILNLNIHAEFFYRDVCNLLFDLNLKNANSEQQNIEAIDLIDKTNKVIIQVSATGTKQKINQTLSKETLAEYKKQGYRLRFLFLSRVSPSLRKGKFNNKFGITFDPKDDILDKDSILGDILESNINKQNNLYELFKKELGENPDVARIYSNLAELINVLSREDLGSSLNQAIVLHEFNIDSKIKFNELDEIKGIIDNYKIYYSKVNAIYNEFDKQGNNKSLSVLNKLSRFYSEELLDKSTDGNQKFLNIINKTVIYVKQSTNFTLLHDEELEQCVSTIVVDAFIRCRIFENPEGYEYVTA